jgi:hypothetical protein
MKKKDGGCGCGMRYLPVKKFGDGDIDYGKKRKLRNSKRKSKRRKSKRKSKKRRSKKN